MPWRPNCLSRAQQEERRLAAQPYLDDPTQTTRDLATQFGVAEVTIRAWRARLRRRGGDALRASLAPGRPHHLTAEQPAQIQAVLDGDSRGHGFETRGWTIPRIRRVIGVTSGLWLDRGHLSRLLRRWGCSYQRAVERNEEDIATWVRNQGSVMEKKSGPGRDRAVRR